VFPAPSIWIYCIVALGAAGVYFLLPKAGRSTKAGGAVLALAALAALIVFSVREFTSERTDIYYYIFSSLALIAATLVITQTRPVYSALYVVVLILAVAGLCLLLEAEFLAAALVMIYGGAILVTYVFVIMLAQQSGQSIYDRRARGPFAACFVGFLLVATIGGAMTEFISSVEPRAEAPEVMHNTQAVGLLVMTRYVVVLEVAGVLLLLALVGAIAIARKRFPPLEEYGARRKPKLGEAGRTAPPF